MLKKSISTVFFCLYVLTGFSQVSLVKFPKNLQLYQRKLNNYADIIVSGNASILSVDSVFLEIYANDSLIKKANKKITQNDSLFSFAISLEAKLIKYNFKFYYKPLSQSSHILTNSATNVLVGEAIMLYGQSNMVAYAGVLEFNSQYSDEYIRNAGYNYYTNIFAWNYGKTPTYEIGTIGSYIGKYFIDSLKIPALILNSSIGGAGIEYLSNYNINNKFDWDYPYGKMLSKLRDAEILDKIRIMAFNQGENEVTLWTPAINAYPSYFNILYQNLNNDLPQLKALYVFQTNILTSTTYQQRAGYIRDFQRNLENTTSKIQTISLVGEGIYDGVHYGGSAYIKMSKDLFYKIKRDFFAGLNDVQEACPKIQYAIYNANKDTVSLVFDKNQHLKVEDQFIYSDRTYYFRDMFYFSTSAGTDNSAAYHTIIKGYKITKNVLQLALYNLSLNASYISYLPGTFIGNSGHFEGPVIRNSHNKSALIFYDLPILNASQENNANLEVKNLKASSVSINSIVLNWDLNITNIDSVIIESSLDSINFKPIATIASNTRYLAKNLKDNQYYFFRIKTKNAQLLSTYVYSNRATTYKTEKSCNSIILNENIIDADLLINANDIKIKSPLISNSRIEMNANSIEIKSGFSSSINSFLLINAKNDCKN